MRTIRIWRKPNPVDAASKQDNNEKPNDKKKLRVVVFNDTDRRWFAAKR